jgi:hypothetical protein
MPEGNPTARVFIWYPHIDRKRDDKCIGHASLYIGNYEVGKNFQLSLDPEAPGGVVPTALDRNLGMNGVHHNDNYVSWWPKGNFAGPVQPKLAAPCPGLYRDVNEEGSEPHDVYDVFGLNVCAMRACWKQTCDPDAHYQFVRKSCATIVAKVLEAGGALDKLDTLDNLWYGMLLYWTPKRVAQICDRLRDKDLAIKTKAGNCPKKGEDLCGIFTPQAIAMC